MKEEYKQNYAEYLRECADNLDDINSVNKNYETLMADGCWACNDCLSHVLTPARGIRKKLKTITLNGIEVVPPITDRLPEYNQDYWLVDLGNDNGLSYSMYAEDEKDYIYIRYGWFENEDEGEKFVNALFAPYKFKVNKED